jgi:hypothetical protein
MQIAIAFAESPEILSTMQKTTGRVLLLALH